MSHQVDRSSFIGGFRSEGFPTQYAENKTAAEVDVLEAGFILAFVILAVAFLIILPAAHRAGKLNIFIRIAVCLLIGGILTTLNFGYRWEVGSIQSNMAYKAGSHAELHKANIAVHFGLRGVNITLHAEGNQKPDELKHEIINYNEEFSWTWDQGRFGFGPFAGRLQRTFREGQRKGLPLPILWVADYLTLDGEGYRFGRFYRTAGWYAHIAMWSAFPCWLLTVILLHTCVRYGAAFLSLTGFFQIVACILWVSIRNPNPLVIPFENATLTTKLGSDFYLVAINGVFCLILGVVIWIFDQIFTEQTTLFFGIDPLTDNVEFYPSVAKPEGGSTANGSESTSPLMPPFSQEPVIMKRRTTIRKVQKKAEGALHKYRRPIPVPRTTGGTIYEDDTPIYGNQSNIEINAAGSSANYHRQI
ncbi:dual oxidase maturation factor 1-like [Neocloeon triangulifer]|uniref:dual oxidase maturation factor 1-like n=1 Tax=Neocloeon triangulifer TaxID=2078957 RepID=UPI00286F48C4|nr:dual oxidase maturation factor 1-like [Neocloeon triangulifer]